MDNLYDCNCEDCKNIELSAKKNITKLFKNVLSAAKRAFKYLHNNGNYKAENIKEKPYQDLVNEINKVFNIAISDNKVPAKMLEKLQKDAFVFSGLKTHAQLLEASKLLLDDKKKIKPFDSFSKDVGKLNNNYNQNYLESEYQFAVNSSQMASKWADVDKQSDRYNLQYRTAADDKVRESHQPLHNITLPINDPFWKEFYPPNGWRCRCTVVEVLKHKYEMSDSHKAVELGKAATSQIGKDGKNRLGIFRFNPGIEERVFPLSHPYNKLEGADEIKKELEWNSIKSYSNGGEITKHILVNEAESDYSAVQSSGEHFAKAGSKVEILPKLHKKSEEYKEIYKKLIGTIYEGKCPDLCVDGEFYELEGFVTKDPKKALKSMLNRGVKQSDKIIIEDTGLTDAFVLRNIQNRVIREGQNISEVWIKKGSDLRLVYKGKDLID